MKIFLIEWSAKVLLQSALDLQNQGAEILYWSGALNIQDLKKEFPKAIFHSAFEAVKGSPAELIDVSEFEPLARDFIEKLHGCEIQTLSMMNRMDYSRVSFFIRKRVYLDQLKYWKGVLEKLRPDAVVFSVVPHMVYDFVLYSVARELGIKTIMFDVVKIADRLLLLDDIKKNGENILMALPESGYDLDISYLSFEVQNYYLKITDPKTVYYPFNLTGQRFHKKQKLDFPTLSGVFKSFKNREFWEKSRQFISRVFRIFTQESNLTSFNSNFRGLAFWKKKQEWLKIKKNFQKEYESLQKTPNLEKKFIFFPLQYQPERTTSPMAGDFSEQVLILDILSKTIPKDWLVYVKEHPTQWALSGTHAHQGRYSGYYQEMAKYPNVVLCPMNVSTNDLILKSQATATATGTAGWEALLKGKPALVFGWPFYQYANGVFKINSLLECQNAIQEIQDGFLPSKQKVLNFLCALDKKCVKAHLGARYETKSSLSDVDCAKNIAKAILNL